MLLAVTLVAACCCCACRQGDACAGSGHSNSPEDYIAYLPGIAHISLETAGFLVSVCDIVAVAILLVFIVVFRRKIEGFGAYRVFPGLFVHADGVDWLIVRGLADASSKTTDKIKNSASYAVFIRNLPPNIQEQEVR